MIIGARIEKTGKTLKNLSLVHVFWAGIAFIAAQKFLLPGVSALVCLIPFAVAVINFTGRERLRNSMMFLALFWSIDIGVSENDATPALIRYLIYVTTILTLCLNSAITKKGILGTFIAFIFYAATTLAHVSEHLSSSQLWDDVRILILGALLFSLKKKRPYELDISLIFFASVGYLLSESANFLAFSTAWHGSYMSYDTTKYLIVIPSLVALFVGRPLVTWALVGLTIMVLVGYTSRTLFLAYLISLVCILALARIEKGLSTRVFAIASLGLAMLMAGWLDITMMLESSKALYMFIELQSRGIQAFAYLDPVRFTSASIFFNLPLIDLLLGRGLGSGIYDASGMLSFVRLEETAFSAQELDTGYFFNFHDVWVDVGLRFGLLPFSVFIVWLLRLRPIGNLPGTAIWVLALIGVPSAFYGTAGLVSIAVLIRVLQSSRVPYV